MDFFDRQERARRSTRVLVVYFALAVLATVLATYAALSLILLRGLVWEPAMALVVLVGTLAVIGGGSAYKRVELAAGGSAVATMLGGRLVQPSTTDSDERKLLNVVEEMALASGVPVPQVYLLADEVGINAFAAGHSPGDAVIGVTRGAIRVLSRDELQGVMGHEFSHILNGDMRLNLRLISLIFGIMGLAIVGRVLLHIRGERNPTPLIGVALIAIGSLGFLFGRLIQSAVSRQREFLADAAAVQFTRNPDGLAGALKKIGGLARGSLLQSPQADQASHLFFGGGSRSALSGLFATHPPLAQRIQAIQPSWDGEFPVVSLPSEAPSQDTTPGRPVPRRAPVPRGLPFPLPLPGSGGITGLAPAVASSEALADTGAPRRVHMEYAADTTHVAPAELLAEAHEPLGASALIYALLIGREPSTREHALELLAGATSPGVRAETERLLPRVAGLPREAWLPLVDVALPALRELSPQQFVQLHAAVKLLSQSDARIDLFEYMLARVLLHHLRSAFARGGHRGSQFHSFTAVAGDAQVVLSALVHLGARESAAATEAYRRVIAGLPRNVQLSPRPLPPEACDLKAIDRALDRLAECVPAIKRQLLRACAEAVAADGVIKLEEAELLRAIADSLDCPIPPFVAAD